MSCPECVSGSIHTGTPVGTEIKVGGYNAYVVGAEDSKRIIVIGADVFGWKFANTRLLADEYAAKGFRVVVPDLFNGYEIPLWSLETHDPTIQKTLFQRFIAAPASLFILVPFVLRNMPQKVEAISTITAALRTSQPDAKIGYVGFCWGGRFAFTQNALFEATVACHPSLVKFPKELNDVTSPFSLAVAATDNGYDKEKALKTEKILREKGLKDVQVVVYEGVHHGWTTRAKLADEVQKKARDDAVVQVVSWFEKHLSGSSGESVSPPPTEAAPATE